MTSLLDQYEQNSQRSGSVYQGTSRNILGEEEKPMFRKCLKSPNFDVAEQVTHMAVSDDSLVLLMSNGKMRWYDKFPQLFTEVELNRIVPGVSARGLHLDPTGEHLLISFPTELLYQKKKTKPRPVSKLKNHEVTAVGWQTGGATYGDNSTTKPILLGTNKGNIFEAELISSGTELYSKMVFNIGKDAQSMITGLSYHCVGCKEDSTEYIIIATTVNRLYHFTGHNKGQGERPLLQPIFNRYLNLTNESFQEIPNRLKYSCLHFCSPPFESHTPDQLGWLTETGIFHCQIDPRNENTIFTNTRMLNLPDGPVPLDFVMTEFHILLLYPDNVTGISILNEEIVFVDYYNETYGGLVGITKDPQRGSIWLYSLRGVYKYVVSKEDKNVWQIYLDKKNYELAIKYCRNYPEHLDHVHMRQADDLFNEKRYEESALIYAQTSSSFEDIALKFLGQSQNHALKTFLRKKFFKLREGEKAQVTMLLLWILELMLSELALLRVYSKQNTSEYDKLQKELELFLSNPEVQRCTKSNKNSVYDLMSRHGDQNNLTKFALLNMDYERVINDYIYKDNYLQALAVLKQQPSSELWYQFAPVLVQCKAKETLQAIREQDRPLNPAKLLPALITAHTNQSSEVMKYLEYCVNNLNCQEEAVHNLLISLYSQDRPERLKRYFDIQGEEASMVNYNIGYALRVCQQQERWEACVQLSSMLGLWENSVEQALKISVQLAKKKASQANDRKLWLKIAEHIIKKEKDTAQALSFLQECDCIKIEDILPFFPDSITIDHFKDAICSSLQEYNQHIQDLNEEMDEATKSAEAIRNEIQSFRSKYTIIQTTDKCASCNDVVLQKPLKPFYTFPCNHKFHTTCLMDQLTPLLSIAERERLLRLQTLLNSPSSSAAAAAAAVGGATTGDSLATSSRDKIKSEIDSIIASQCLYCGDRMIALIKKPLIPDEEYEKILEEWK